MVATLDGTLAVSGMDAIIMIDRRQAILGVATLVVVGTAEGVADDSQKQETRVIPPVERVLGIGGFFFRSREPKKLAEWYQLHLGIDPVPTDYDHKTWEQTAGPTAFSPFSMTSDYLGPPQQSWMLNFRVRNLDAMAAQLRKAPSR